jgi:hypothetical protein
MNPAHAKSPADNVSGIFPNKRIRLTPHSGPVHLKPMRQHLTTPGREASHAVGTSVNVSNPN